jgi:hypothetical protein
MEITYKIRNMTGQTLSDLRAVVKIPGFNIEYDKQYKKKNFLAAEEEFFQKIQLQIPQDIPPSKHKISLSVRAESLDKTLRGETQTFFEVR